MKSHQQNRKLGKQCVLIPQPSPPLLFSLFEFELFQAQLSGKSSGGGGSSGSNTNAGPGEGKDVVELTDANFRKKVLNSDKVKGNVISMINDKSIKGVLKRERKSIDLKLCGKLPRIDLYFSLFIRHRYTIQVYR